MVVRVARGSRRFLHSSPCDSVGMTSFVLQRESPVLQGGVGFEGAGGTRDGSGQEDEGSGDESGDEPGDAAEVIGQRTAVAGEEYPIPHDVQMKQRREGREDANGQGSALRGGSSRKSMRGPIQRLGQTRHAENHDRIAKKPRMK